MNRITKLAAVIGTFATLSLGAVAIAGPHGPGHHGPPGPEGAILQAIKQLDLTDEQVQMLKEIRETNRAEHEKARADRERTMQVFKRELLSDNPNAERLHKLIDDREAEMVQRAHDRLDTMLEVHAVLTPDQRAQIGEKLEEMRERHEERRARFDERRGEESRERRGR